VLNVSVDSDRAPVVRQCHCSEFFMPLPCLLFSNQAYPVLSAFYQVLWSNSYLSYFHARGHCDFRTVFFRHL